MNPIRSMRASTLLLALAATAAQGKVGSPYTPDADTLHLWHLDAVAVPVNDQVTFNALNLAVLGGGATLGNAGYTGFGNALSTYDAGPDVAGGTGTDAYLAPFTLVNGTGDNVATWSFADAATGAFTMEALVRLDFDPLFSQSTRGNAPMQLISGEQEGTTGRTWQFRYDQVGYNPNADGFTTALTTPALEFISVRNAASGQIENRILLLPTTGPNAVAQGVWFHVAVTYDGNAGYAGNLKFYWTRLDSGVTEAALLGVKTLANDLSNGPVDFAIGQTGRHTSQNNFVGLIDEVRISKVARPATGFMFFPDSDNDGLDDNWEVLHFILPGEDPVADLATILARQDGTGDPDNDTFTNAAEWAARSDPNDPLSVPSDTDADDLPDSWEMTCFGNLAQIPAGDPDNDHNTNAEELAAGTDPNSNTSWPDTDDGGIGDGLNDGWEIHYFGDITTCTATDDPDSDGFNNLEEQTAETDPTQWTSSPDSDGDGLIDGWEVHYFIQPGEVPYDDLFTIIARYIGTDDPDGDGSNNEAEETGGSDPTDLNSRPYDLDGDGLVDAWEIQQFTDTAAQDADGDLDTDTFTNAQEQTAGSNPNSAASTPDDIDGDGVPNADRWLVPYAVDAHTLHLWDLNDAGTPIADRVYAASNLPLLALQNGATLGNASFPGFGTALTTNAGYATTTGAYLAAKTAGTGTTDTVTTTWAGADGAFTFEALVRLDFAPLAVLAGNPPRMQILSAEEDAGQDAHRIFQFALTPCGSQGNPGPTPRICLINIDADPLTAGEQAQTIEVQVPETGTHAPVQGAWYHVAVAYNGNDDTADNLKFYWTRLDSGAAAANSIGSGQMIADLRATPADVCIGNETRDTGGASGPFEGLVDEVRVSDIARADSAFLFQDTTNPDADSDNLPDAWEFAHFGDLLQTASGDFDHDGTSNRSEYLLGLDPADAGSRFAAGLATGPAIQWQGAAGLTFVVQRSTTLAADSWSDLATVPGVDGLNSFPDPAPPAGKAFYRVLLTTP